MYGKIIALVKQLHAAIKKSDDLLKEYDRRRPSPTSNAVAKNENPSLASADVKDKTGSQCAPVLAVDYYSD